ncbi:MAG: septum formation initiator family protein [Paludibacteraceae bacterium]|nr:septum formation initiator family protein [Paludibacteraceae bacterium]MED9996553.1 septum formation initiator family protein [Paludibacteraceae bacterium]
MKKIFKFLSSNIKILKYLLVAVVFLVAMFASREHNLQTRIKNTITIKELKKEIDYYQTKSKQNQERLQELKSDTNDLEKFARERYRMHAPNEDVYVVDYE